MATVTGYTKAQDDSLLGVKTAAATTTPLAASGLGVTGIAIRAAREDHQHPAVKLSAADRGLAGMPLEPTLSGFTGAATFTSGTVYVTRVRLEQTTALSSASIVITTAGTGLSNCYMGVYRISDGAQLAISADQSASWASIGVKTATFISPTAILPAGTDVYVAYIYNGSALAGMSAGTALQINLGITLYGSAGSGQTALPSPLGTVSPATTPRYVGVA